MTTRTTSSARERAVPTRAHASPRTLGEALARGRATLARHRCARTDATREAETLLAAAARITREALFTHPTRALSPVAWHRYDALLARRLAHEPLEYILGFAQFDGLTLRVNQATLVPRPATESLVEAAMAEAVGLTADLTNPADLLIADVGTGSGCIAIALAMRLPDTKVIAVDSSPTALRLARANAKRLASSASGRLSNLRFGTGDLADPSDHFIASVAKQSRPTLRPLLLVTNPPYIPHGAMHRLPADVRLFEPASALDGGGRDGLDCFRAILDQLRAVSTIGPVILVGEHLDTQYMRFAKEIAKRFPKAKPEPVRNLAGIIIGTSCRLR